MADATCLSGLCVFEFECRGVLSCCGMDQFCGLCGYDGLYGVVLDLDGSERLIQREREMIRRDDCAKGDEQLDMVRVSRKRERGLFNQGLGRYDVVLS